MIARNVAPYGGWQDAMPDSAYVRHSAIDLSCCNNADLRKMS
jgi:hypothetical protein